MLDSSLLNQLADLAYIPHDQIVGGFTLTLDPEAEHHFKWRLEVHHGDRPVDQRYHSDPTAFLRNGLLVADQRHLIVPVIAAIYQTAELPPTPKGHLRAA